MTDLPARDIDAIRHNAANVVRRAKMLTTSTHIVRLWDVIETSIHDTPVLQVTGSSYVAVPVGHAIATSKKFDILRATGDAIHPYTFVCQVNNKEVRSWLIRAADGEGVEPSRTETITRTIDGNMNRVYP